MTSWLKRLDHNVLRRTKHRLKSRIHALELRVAQQAELLERMARQTELLEKRTRQIELLPKLQTSIDRLEIELCLLPAPGDGASHPAAS